MDFVKLLLTSLLSVAALFVTAKIMGHKQVSQLDFFDYISGITMGSIAAELATELETPWKPLVALLIYGAISVLFSFLTGKFPRSRRIINGSPTIIMDGGKLYRDSMKKSKLDLSDFLMMCRQQGYFDLGDIQTAVFEYNGKITILPTSASRPATPQDMNMNPPASSIFTEVIMDGRVLDGNLTKLGLDAQWLKNQLNAQNFHSAKEIYLGLCDNNKSLSLYKNE